MSSGSALALALTRDGRLRGGNSLPAVCFDDFLGLEPCLLRGVGLEIFPAAVVGVGASCSSSPSLSMTQESPSWGFGRLGCLLIDAGGYAEYE